MMQSVLQELQRQFEFRKRTLSNRVMLEVRRQPEYVEWENEQKKSSTANESLDRRRILG